MTISPHKLIQSPSIWKHQSTKFNDVNYAETVFRTVIGPDGKVKENYFSALQELNINSKDIADLKLEDFKKDGNSLISNNVAQVRFDYHKEKRRFKLIQLGDLIKMMNTNQTKQEFSLPRLNKISPSGQDVNGGSFYNQDPQRLPPKSVNYTKRVILPIELVQSPVAQSSSSPTRFGKQLQAWERQDQLILKRQQKIQQDIIRQEVAQKKREKAFKEVKKHRAEQMKKKQADIYNALTSVKQQALEIDRTALKEYKLHVDELRDRERQIEIKNKKHSEQMRLKIIDRHRESLSRNSRVNYSIDKSITRNSNQDQIKSTLTTIESKLESGLKRIRSHRGETISRARRLSEVAFTRSQMMKDESEKKEFQDNINLVKRLQLLDKKLKETEKKKKKTKEAIATRNSKKEWQTQSTIKQHQEQGRQRMKSFNEKQQQLSQDLQQLEKEMKLQVEARQEKNRLRFDDTRRRLSFVNEISSFYKKRVFEKHQRIDQQVDQMQQKVAYNLDMHRVSNDLRVQKLESRSMSTVVQLMNLTQSKRGSNKSVGLQELKS